MELAKLIAVADGLVLKQQSLPRPTPAPGSTAEERLEGGHPDRDLGTGRRRRQEQEFVRRSLLVVGKRHRALRASCAVASVRCVKMLGACVPVR
jgi:hypothetical protein